MLITCYKTKENIEYKEEEKKKMINKKNKRDWEKEENMFIQLYITCVVHCHLFIDTQLQHKINDKFNPHKYTSCNICFMTITSPY